MAATLRPSPDSDIRIEVWLPAENWNGKFQAVGNSGWGGYISYPAMARALAHGYASASTDTGHATEGASFAMGHPEKLVDFGSRAVHEMTVEAKAALTCSIGIASNKLLAKLASDMQKPDGLVLLRPEDLPEAILHLRLQDISGIGANMHARLNRAGIRLRNITMMTTTISSADRKFPTARCCRSSMKIPVSAFCG